MKILIISEYIAPLQAVASIRWTKIAKYLKLALPDASITVLTNQQQFTGPARNRSDPLLQKDMRCFDAYWQIPEGKELALYEKLKRRRLKTTLELQNRMQTLGKTRMRTRVKKELLLLVRDIKETICLRQGAKFLRGRELDFDVVISTYGPAWPHLLAEQVKREHPAMLWLADFRDPYAKDTDTAFAWHRHNAFVRRHCRQADVITRVSGNLHLNEPPGVPIQTIPNGYDPSEAMPPLPPDEFSIVFTGRLYGEKRDLGIVCKALKELASAGLVQNAAVLYAGPDDALARQLAGRYDAQDHLKAVGVLPRLEALRIQQKAAVLLQLDWNTAKNHCEWSGKMYEYMMARKPILFVVTGDEPNSFPSRHMGELGGCCYEQCRHNETYPRMKRYILDKYTEWKTTGNVTIQRDEGYVRKFSYEEIAKMVGEAIQKND